ncbi:MAG: long-chain-fatty-acid--CoA ligase [Desulfobacteraceae bacterium]|nr:MAG: long-chain-fatty-acid--CoA ligase [Desulfobacteraceae bacterium]
MNTAAWIRKWALLAPERVALTDDARTLTYRELNRRINRLANLLIAKGVRKGDRVAALLQNSAPFLEIFFAVSQIGSIFVPLNFRLAPREITFEINDCKAETFFFDQTFIPMLQEIRKDLPISEERYICVNRSSSPPYGQDYETLLQSASDQEPSTVPTMDPESPHIIMYTSGTTGLPKGAVLPQRKTFFNVLNANFYYQVSTEDRVVVSRPLFHSGGLLVDSLPFLYKGGTVFMKRRFDPEELLRSVEQHRATVMETSATMYRFILEACDPARFDLSSVRCFFTGGEQVPLALLRTYAEKGILISQIFGQTETSTVTWLPVEHALRKMGSVGIPVFHGEVRVADENGREMPVGASGEILVSGPILMSGYWGQPELSRKTIKDGWLHTGDLGTRDEEGFYYILDRVKNVFISGGENVYPAEVERTLLENPMVSAAAVFGVPDPKWGAAGKAFVVVERGKTTTEAELRKWCVERLAGYKVPAVFEFVDKIPENAGGKIIRYRLGEETA